MLFTAAVTLTTLLGCALAADTYEEAYELNASHNHAYGYGMYGFWGGVVLLGMICKLWQESKSLLVTRTTTDVEGQGKVVLHERPGPFDTIDYWTRTNLTTPPAFGTYHARLRYWCTIPTRAEGVVVVAYWIFTIILLAVGYEYYPADSPAESLTGTSLHNQHWKVFGDRCALLTISTLPIVWLFSGRNNIFTWATGWSFQTFNIFHRHVARVVILLTIGHSVAYTHLALTVHFPGGVSLWDKAIHYDWFIWGIVGGTSMGAFWLASFSWIRRKFYDAFLLIHIGLGIVVIYSIFRHTAKEENAFNNYLWPVVAIWSFDRLLRLIRLVACNVHVTYSKRVLRFNSTTATYDEESDIIKVQIDTAGLGRFSPVPGQYCFLYQPLTWKFYENHPFTVGASSATPPSPSSSDNSLPTSLMEKDIRMDSIAPALSSGFSSEEESADESTTVSATGAEAVIFWIRPYDGWTRRLKNRCLKSPSRTCHPHLLLEGPYGQSEKLHNFDTVIMIAGGTGLSAVMPYIKDHVSRTSAGTSQVTDLRLIWSSRKVGFVHSICDTELSSVLRRPDFRMEAYLTDDMSDPASSSLDDVKGISNLEYRQGRPDLDHIIKSAVQELGSDRRCAVFVCGPAAMADDARAASHAVMKSGRRYLEYFEDAFGW